ncbi:hypothetical protein [Eubacterium ventriosum]|uniref:hypothetical protein n=1 Tax=Eubacterium ventriosum TaxID=39496 RepID=UPI0035202DFC
MNKKLISIVTIMAMLVVMIIPAWADGGDNTGDDNFGAAIYVKKDGVEGAYTLGTAKEFKLEFWASGIVGKQVVRTVSVTGDNQVSSIEYKDGGEWYDISGFNKEMTIAGNDLDRTIRVVFDKEGRYTISYGLVNTEGQDVVKDQLNIEIELRQLHRQWQRQLQPQQQKQPHQQWQKQLQLQQQRQQHQWQQKQLHLQQQRQLQLQQQRQQHQQQ